MTKFAYAKSNDVNAIAGIHCEELPSELSSLGIKIVKRFYINLIARNTGKLILLEHDDCVAGFTLFSTSGDKLFRASLLNSFSDLLYLVINFPKKELLKHAIISIFSSNKPPARCCELVYLAVSSQYRGGGFGRMLLERTEELVRSEGCGSLELEVDRENTDALALYRSNGYMIKTELSRGRQRKYRMIKTLSK